MKDILKFFMPEQQLNRLAEDLKRDNRRHGNKESRDIKRPYSKHARAIRNRWQGWYEVVLHYFINGSHWFIIERDSTEEQFQAFGYACLHGNYQFAELGYISIGNWFGIMLSWICTGSRKSSASLKAIWKKCIAITKNWIKNCIHLLPKWCTISTDISRK